MQPRHRADVDNLKPIWLAHRGLSTSNRVDRFLSTSKGLSDFETAPATERCIRIPGEIYKSLQVRLSLLDSAASLPSRLKHWIDPCLEQRIADRIPRCIGLVTPVNCRHRLTGVPLETEAGQKAHLNRVAERQRRLRRLRRDVLRCRMEAGSGPGPQGELSTHRGVRNTV